MNPRFNSAWLGLIGALVWTSAVGGAAYAAVAGDNAAFPSDEQFQRWLLLLGLDIIVVVGFAVILRRAGYSRTGGATIGGALAGTALAVLTLFAYWATHQS